MTKDEALKMVNQVLDDKNHYPDEEIPTLVMDALQACKEALAETQEPTKEEILGKVFDAVYAQYQPKAETQEPVAWKDKIYGNLHHADYGDSIPLYTTPPKAEFIDGDYICPSCKNKSLYKTAKSEWCVTHKCLYQHDYAWQGLTAEEINSIPLNEHTVQAVENLLREKNG